MCRSKEVKKCERVCVCVADQDVTVKGNNVACWKAQRVSGVDRIRPRAVVSSLIQAPCRSADVRIQPNEGTEAHKPKGGYAIQFNCPRGSGESVRQSSRGSKPTGDTTLPVPLPVDLPSVSDWEERCQRSRY